MPLSVPFPLAVGTCYNACTGFTGSFPNTNNQSGAATHTPLDSSMARLPPTRTPTGRCRRPTRTSQGVFGVAGTDPSVNMPGSGSNSANFWMDLRSRHGPHGIQRLIRLWPNNWDAEAGTLADNAVNYVVATEVHLSQSCTLNKIWYYRPRAWLNSPPSAGYGT